MLEETAETAELLILMAQVQFLELEEQVPLNKILVQAHLKELQEALALLHQGQAEELVYLEDRKLQQAEVAAEPATMPVILHIPHLMQVDLEQLL